MLTGQARWVNLKKNGFKLNYFGKIEKGKLPLVFLHGAGGNGSLWQEQLKGLAEEFSPLAVDLPGHGASEGQAANRISIYRQCIKDFKDTLELPPYVLGGHSMGGAITIDYALNHPEDLRAIILVATGGKLRVLPQILEKYRQGIQQPELVRHLYGPDAPEELIKEGKEMLMSVPPAVSYADFTACDNFNVLNELERIKIPTLVLCGDQDVMTPPKYSQFLAEKMPGAALKIIPGGGHMLMLEKPRDVNKAIIEFLKKLPD